MKADRSFLFPARCPFCGTLLSKAAEFCEKCAGDLSRIPAGACRTCGVEKGLCDCGKRKFFVRRRIAPFYYEGAAKTGILRFKKEAHFGGFRTLASLTAAKIREEYADVAFDLVVCVPSSDGFSRERDFNPSALLGKEIARLLKLPFDRRFLVKVFDTKPQKGMSRTDRIGNVAGVFGLRKPKRAEGKTILLIDDVITTGATVNECAKMLRIFGAKAVYAAAVCVAKPLKKNSK